MAKATAKLIGTHKGLPLYRKMLRFGASDQESFINVVYEEYCLAPNGIDKVDIVEKEYIIRDRFIRQPKIVNGEVQKGEDGNTIYEEIPTTSRFSAWDAQLGDLIRTEIDETLKEVIPINSKNLEQI